MVIEEIRESPWFAKDTLPEYLVTLAVQSSEAIDTSVVIEIEQLMGFSQMTIMHCLLNETDNNQIKVAYQLICDNRMNLIANASYTDAAHLGINPPAWKSLAPRITPVKPTIVSEHGAVTSIQVLSSSFGQMTTEPQYTTNVNRPKARAKWHYGIRSRSHPYDIMLEIYRAVQNIGMRFKSMDPYRIRCIYTTASDAKVFQQNLRV